jgi:hypothetical protein
MPATVRRRPEKVTAEEIEQDNTTAVGKSSVQSNGTRAKLALLQRIYENHTATVYQWAR